MWEKIFSEEQWREIGREIVAFLPKLGSAVLILLAFSLISAVISGVITRLADQRDIHQDLLHILIRLMRWSLLAVGLITALGTLGINVGALVAGLGLTGFALGLALKDIIGNILAGVLIIVYKPFQRTDQIEVTGLKGTVLQIDLRFTTLELEDRRILIPNSNLLTNAITVMRGQTLKSPQPRS